MIEIAESSLATDRSDMARIYAGARIPVSWIVNLLNRQIEVDTRPCADGYESHQEFASDQEVPVMIEGDEVGRIPVSDLVP